MPAAFDPAVLAADPGPRADVLAALAGALAAADPAAAVRRHFRLSRAGLQVGGARMPFPKGRVFVLAFGKAAPAMAEAALDVLAGSEIIGLVASPSGAAVGSLEAVAAGHPLPDAGSLRAGGRLLALATAAGPHDLVLVLVSGGGSALAESPAPGLRLEDLDQVNRALLRSGAPITEVNTVRRHLSAFKGGRLAAAAAPALLVTLILSDVVGSPLEAIAGGPTVPDPTTFADALAVLARWKVAPPPAVLAALRAGSGRPAPRHPRRRRRLRRAGGRSSPMGRPRPEGAAAAARRHRRTRASSRRRCRVRLASSPPAWPRWPGACAPARWPCSPGRPQSR